MSDTIKMSDRAEAEYHPNAEPPVFLVRHEADHGGDNEVYLTPDEAKKLAAFISKAKLRARFTNTNKED